jgi:phage-related baseplate assembly protein
VKKDEANAVERNAGGLRRSLYTLPTREEAIVLVDAATRISWYGEKAACPRCGKDLLYEQLGNSFTVACLDEECIEAGGRGI